MIRVWNIYLHPPIKINEHMYRYICNRLMDPMGIYKLPLPDHSTNHS